jgi:hypothetical protein
MNTRPIARVIGNTGLYFVTPYAGSAMAVGAPSVETAIFSAIIGLILTSSRELVEYGKQRNL